jgi:uncharacterized membrane protein
MQIDAPYGYNASSGSTEVTNMPFAPSIWIILGPILVIAVLSIALMVLIPKKEKPPESAWSGPFYADRGDPSIFVPKRYGIGYTLNFGNPWSWFVLLLIVALATSPLVFSALFLRHLPR